MGTPPLEIEAVPWPSRLLRTVREAAGRYLTLVKDAIPLLALLLYGSLRVAYDAFYVNLGFSAEEVGIGYATVISDAAVGLLFAGSLGVTLIAFGALVWSIAKPWWAGDTPEDPSDEDDQTDSRIAGGWACSSWRPAQWPWSSLGTR